MFYSLTYTISITFQKIFVFFVNISKLKFEFDNFFNHGSYRENPNSLKFRLFYFNYYCNLILLIKDYTLSIFVARGKVWLISK